jgi:hypothetical protein
MPFSRTAPEETLKKGGNRKVMIEETFRTFLMQIFDNHSNNDNILFGAQLDSFLYEYWSIVDLNE